MGPEGAQVTILVCKCKRTRCLVATQEPEKCVNVYCLGFFFFWCQRCSSTCWPSASTFRCSVSDRYLRANPCCFDHLRLCRAPHCRSAPHLLSGGDSVFVLRVVHTCRWTCTAHSMCLSSVICHLECRRSRFPCWLAARSGMDAPVDEVRQ